MSRTRPRRTKARDQKWQEKLTPRPKTETFVPFEMQGLAALVDKAAKTNPLEGLPPIPALDYKVGDRVQMLDGREAVCTATGPDQTLKKDAGKIPLELISELAEEELAKVLAFGAKKYAADGWRRGMEWRRLIGAAKRHLNKFGRGIDHDDETGLLHVAHAMCCCMFLVEYALTGNGTDDRWKGKK